MSTKNKLITRTGSNKKVIINLELANQLLNKETLSRLGSLITELNFIQEFKGGK